jgi:large subunit ribosomal protein L25
MERIELRTETRTARGKGVKRLRADGLIPAVIYGPDIATKSIQIQERSLFKTLTEAGSTTLIDLFVDDDPRPQVVLAREIQHDILTGRLQHVDFYQVRLTEKVKTAPRLEFVGESPLVRSGIAVMIHSMNEVEVECLPTDLISSIPVDVTVLEKMDDNVLIRDLPVPPGVTLLADPDEVVVSVVPTRMPEEEELEEVEEVEFVWEEAAEEDEAEA